MNFMTMNEVAKSLSVSRITVYRLIKSGQLQALKVNKAVRIPENSFQDYIRYNLKNASNIPANSDKTKELMSLAGKWSGPKEEYEAILKAIEESQANTEF